MSYYELSYEEFILLFFAILFLIGFLYERKRAKNKRSEEKNE